MKVDQFLDADADAGKQAPAAVQARWAVAEDATASGVQEGRLACSRLLSARVEFFPQQITDCFA